MGAHTASILIDGREYSIASVLAYNPMTDLALVKINANGLTAAKLCSSPCQTGETVFTYGSSKGFVGTCAQGIITHANREVKGVTHLQHDAAMSGGNSGGALINTYGEVIGVNTWHRTDGQNLNFAVAIDELDNINYITPCTVTEFYEDMFGDPFNALKNSI